MNTRTNCGCSKSNCECHNENYLTIADAGTSPHFPKTYTEKEVRDMLRTLTYMVDCDVCDVDGCTCKSRKVCRETLIDYAIKNPTPEE